MDSAWASLLSRASGGNAHDSRTAAGNYEDDDPYAQELEEYETERQPPPPPALGKKEAKRASKALKEWTASVLDGGVCSRSLFVSLSLD